jgi:hypothetical protein
MTGQLELFAAADPLAGLAVHIGRSCPCGGGTYHVGQPRGPHRAELRCTQCDRFGGWLPHAAASFIEKTIHQFGRPTQPIVVRPFTAMRDGGNFSHARTEEATEMATKSERFPKRFLSAPDLKGKPVKLTIEREYTEELAGSDGVKKLKSILSFKSTDKELVLNQTNFDAICDATGNYDSADWGGQPIVLYPTKTQMAGKPVDCIRVRAPDQKTMKLPPEPAPPPEPALAADDHWDDEVPF